MFEEILSVGPNPPTLPRKCTPLPPETSPCLSSLSCNILSGGGWNGGFKSRLHIHSEENKMSVKFCRDRRVQHKIKLTEWLQSPQTQSQYFCFNKKNSKFQSWIQFMYMFSHIGKPAPSGHILLPICHPPPLTHPWPSPTSVDPQLVFSYLAYYICVGNTWYDGGGLLNCFVRFHLLCVRN